MATNCVLHPHESAVLVSVIEAEHGEGIRRRGIYRDFCSDCIDAGRYDDNFGRCYLCDEDDHAHCIGVPCQCECDGPTDVGRLDNDITDARARLVALESQREQAAS